MTREALKLALEALEWAEDGLAYFKPVDGDKLDAAITAIKAALAAPAQEPVAWVTGLHAGRCVIQTVNPAAILSVGIALYTHPAPAAQQEPDELTIAYMSGLYDGKKHAAQRQWVGLTDEERNECVNTPFVSRQWANIEAKLKEKNNG